jgi:predicted  nucleic acid-binding Zn ribbon protein
MHSLSIKYKNDLDEEKLWHCFYSLIGSLRENGQINGRELNAYIKDNRISMILCTFTETALAKKYFTKYVTDAIEKLEALCDSKIEIAFLGYVEEELNSICTCVGHNYFVLYYYGDFSPIRCGSCEKFVPLFKIPKLHDQRVWDILAWISTYQACKNLDLNCGTGEKWAMRQQCEHDSGLSIQGRKVAAKISETSGIKTYYFLANWSKRPKAKDIRRPCPGCGSDWHLETAKFGYFRHQCDRCLLMSAYSNYHA